MIDAIFLKGKPKFMLRTKTGYAPVFYDKYIKQDKDRYQKSVKPNFIKRRLKAMGLGKVYGLFYNMIFFLDSVQTYYLIDGFLAQQIKVWIKRYVHKGRVIEIGTGRGKVIDFLSKSVTYLGIDVKISETIIQKYYQKNKREFLIASAVNLPLPNSCADYIISMETFEHIPHIKRALNEIYRICKPGAKLFITIPNNYCYKYARKGPHPEHINSWRYQEFIDFMAPNFKVIEGRMIGWWIPIFKHFRYSYQLPFSHKDEYYNSNFLFVFECLKKLNHEKIFK